MLQSTIITATLFYEHGMPFFTAKLFLLHEDMIMSVKTSLKIRKCINYVGLILCMSFSV